MMSFFKNIPIKSSYKSAYGKKAMIKILEDTIEIVIGNKKIIHNKETSNKVEEYYYESEQVRIIKYDENGKVDVEETYVNGEKISEKKLGDGKSTSVMVNEGGLEKAESKYYKDNVEYREYTYNYKNKATDVEYTVILVESEKEILKSILKKKGSEVIIDVQKKLYPDGRINYYKFNDHEIEVTYYGESRMVKTYSRHWEEPVFESEDNSKNKKNNKSAKEDNVKKQVGTKINKEILEYSEKGNILYLETNDECIRREFDDDGNLKKQYNILETDFGKEIVGKIITGDKDIKIINNSTLSNDEIVKINEQMDNIEVRYTNNLVMMHDFILFDEGIEVTDEYYQINSKLDFTKREYDKIENNVDYHIEETFRNNKLYGVKTINKTSKTELYAEGNRRFIKGFSGVDKEITHEEFDLYKMADSLNKIKS